jgi:hypothetical protein
MNYNTQTTIADLKTCGACRTLVSASHNFCRICGARQAHPDAATVRLDNDSNKTPLTRGQNSNNSIQMLASGTFRPVSSSVLKSVVTTQLTRSTSRIRNRATRNAVAAAITVPLWLMIVLLSPLDALQASKKVVQQL